VIMNHNGFTAEVGYEDGDRLMHGSVINTRAVLHFAGGNIEELHQAFADTIADYPRARAEISRPLHSTRPDWTIQSHPR
jgi:predicted HicB family RNase H-like nuclease